MPERLWDEASLLARELGVHAVKCALGLNYESLKKRVGSVREHGCRRSQAPGFLALSGAQLLGPGSGALVEVADADGSRLTVQLGTGSELDVAGLVEAFRRRAWIQITPQMRVLVAVEAADFRRGIDGLAQLCRAVLQADPFTGTLLVFRNRRCTAIKLLVYDGQGLFINDA